MSAAEDAAVSEVCAMRECGGGIILITYLGGCAFKRMKKIPFCFDYRGRWDVDRLSIADFKIYEPLLEFFFNSLFLVENTILV